MVTDGQKRINVSSNTDANIGFNNDGGFIKD